MAEICDNEVRRTKELTLAELFQAEADHVSVQLKRCGTCIHRKRYELNERSAKVVQCCELQPSKRSNSGYKTIKVTDVACTNYQETSKQKPT